MLHENFKIIARIQNDFSAKFGIPRQSNLVPELESLIVFEPDYRNADALRGLAEFSHLWVIWLFSENQRAEWSPTVRPPRLGGNARMGVFATRSPFRPNPIGLSALEICKVYEDPTLGPVIKVRGADLMNGTPVLDIKPYIPSSDSYPQARAGFAATPPAESLNVVFAADFSAVLPPQKAAVLRAVLAHDPRPPYHNDPERVYGMEFGGVEVKFLVKANVLTVLDIRVV